MDDESNQKIVEEINMKKKVGILTFMQNNYGAVLQAYALQRYLRNISDYDVEVINFTTDWHLKSNRIYGGTYSNWVAKLVFFILKTLRLRALLKRKNRTDVFKKSHINISSERYTSDEMILNKPPIKDIYITGSDQVFNPNGQYYKVYYLGFDKNNARKVAYAPSFGVSNFTDEIKNKISNYILDFDALSCRESVGAEYLSAITNKIVPTVVDPTLLLTKQQWFNVAIKPNYKYKYIFIYDLNGAENLVKIAQKIRDVTDYKIVCLTGKVQKFYKVDKQIYDAGPSEWLGWIANAEFVVTDSFHGTVLSTIFEKQFFSYIAVPQTSSRIRNLLTNLSLQNRIVENNCASEFIYNENCVIDYACVSFTQYIEPSYKFIDNHILK